MSRALPPNFPDLRAFDLFLSVVELGSLGQAAAAHGISQPAASSRIVRLERQLGLPLLNRGPRGSIPTAAGIELADLVKPLLDAAQSLVSWRSTALITGDSHLRVAASLTVGEWLVPEWLSLRAKGDGIAVSLEVMNSSEVIERVREGTAEIGFVENTGPVGGLRMTVLGHDQLVCVVAPSHPWAEGTTLTAQMLADAPLILREAGSGTRDSLAAVLGGAGHDLRAPLIELGSPGAVRSAVAEGMGASVLSRLALLSDLQAGRLVEVPVQDLDMTRELRAVWKPDRQLGRAAQELIEIAKRVLN